MWTAVSKEPNITIEAGTEIVVADVEGVKLIVTPGYNAGL
jgi:membrane protein implicated in regulation of membrane protease activity